MRTQRGARADRRTALMASLTGDALWIQDIWRLRCLALQDFSVERRSSRNELGLIPLNPEPSGEKLSLTFTSAAEADRWNDKIQELQSRLNPDAPSVRRTVPEGVALVRKAPEVPHVALGNVAFLHRTAATADRGAQLRAGIRGANAIVDLQRSKCPEMESGARRVNGLAVHVEDADSLNRLRWTWYTEELSTLVWRMLLLVFVEAFTLFLAAAFFQGKIPMSAATGESLTESLASAGVGIGLFFAWPLVLIVLLRILRWRELLRTVGIAVVAVTTVRGLIAVLGHLLAVLTTGTDLADSKIGYLADPVDWAFMVICFVLCLRAWQLHSRSRQILPEEALVSSLPRKLLVARFAWDDSLVSPLLSGRCRDCTVRRKLHYPPEGR